MAHNLSQYSIGILNSVLNQYNSLISELKSTSKFRSKSTSEFGSTKKWNRHQPQKLESNNILNYSALSSCVFEEPTYSKSSSSKVFLNSTELSKCGFKPRMKRLHLVPFTFENCIFGIQSIRKWFFDQWKREQAHRMNGTYYLLITISSHLKVYVLWFD